MDAAADMYVIRAALAEDITLIVAGSHGTAHTCSVVRKGLRLP